MRGEGESGTGRRYGLLLALALAAALTLVDWRLGRSVKFIQPDTLRDVLKPGPVYRLRDLVGGDATTICVLTPYQRQVRRDAPDSARINAHLKDSGYPGEEHQWALVLARADAVDVAIFKRSAQLDVMVPDPDARPPSVELPAGFRPADCAPFGAAALVKVVVRNRTHIVLGVLPADR